MNRERSINLPILPSEMNSSITFSIYTRVSIYLLFFFSKILYTVKKTFFILKQIFISQKYIFIYLTKRKKKLKFILLKLVVCHEKFFKYNGIFFIFASFFHSFLIRFFSSTLEQNFEKSSRRKKPLEILLALTSIIVNCLYT